MAVPERGEWHRCRGFWWTRIRAFVLGVVVGAISGIVIAMHIISKVVNG